MSQALSAADRLPWLSDEPAPPKRRRSNGRELAGWAVAATLLVASGSYWMGVHSWRATLAQPSATAPSTTVPLPQPRAPQAPQPEATFAPTPQLTPEPVREEPVVRPRIERREIEPIAAPQVHEPQPARVEEAPVIAAPVPAPVPQAPPIVTPRPLALWPATQSQGSYGRIVRIGAFGSRLQAKIGWRYMVDAYPAVAHLPATVVETRNTLGRAFYRFQIGTTSQAHSEVLCQRMTKIHLSCAVVGLPWKPRGVER